MENTNTENRYNKLLISLEKEKQKIKKIKEEIESNYCNHIKEKYPENFVKLEDFLKKPIINITPIEYINEDNQWADMIKIIVHNKNDKIFNFCIREFEIQSSKNWNHNKHKEGIETTENKEINNILKLFYHNLPYTNTAYKDYD
jgi:hypothetical protein